MRESEGEKRRKKKKTTGTYIYILNLFTRFPSGFVVFVTVFQRESHLNNNHSVKIQAESHFLTVFSY